MCSQNVDEHMTAGPYDKPISEIYMEPEGISGSSGGRGVPRRACPSRFFCV